eukprot:3175900-Prymnesium_polylepis.1
MESRYVMIRLSKSSPPRWVSPCVASTSKTPESIVSSDTSNVPPPRSKTRMVCVSPTRSSPYAIAAAVGSFRIRSTLRPAMVPASLVACRCASLKYAGTCGGQAARGAVTRCDRPSARATPGKAAARSERHQPYRDNHVLDGLAEVGLGGVAHLTEDHRRHLLRQQVLRLALDEHAHRRLAVPIGDDVKRPQLHVGLH